MGKFGPEKSKLSILAENWHTEYLEDVDFYSEISFLRFLKALERGWVSDPIHGQKGKKYFILQNVYTEMLLNFDDGTLHTYQLFQRIIYVGINIYNRTM